MLENPNIRASSFARCTKTPERSTKFTNNSHYTHWNHFHVAESPFSYNSIFTNGWFPSKTSLPFEGTIEALRTCPSQTPNAGTPRFGKCQLSWAWPYSPQPHVTCIGSVKGKEKSSVVSTSFKWGEISPLSRVSDNPSYPVISGHLYGFVTPFTTGFWGPPCNHSTKLPVARDPGSPFENGFMEPIKTMRFGGDWTPQSSSENMTIDA